jgi:hypothetical protein
MLNRRNWVSIIALLLVASLAACTAAPVAVPEREIMVDVNTALEAQNKAAGLVMSGNVDWSEAEFSSLLSVLLEQNGGANNPVNDVKVWFEPNNQIVISVGLKDGVLPSGNTLDLAGTVAVENNHVVVDLQQAGAGSMSVSGAVLDPISAQINAALADPSMGVAVDVTTDTGTISVGLGGM